jgi:hypothetical protein
MVDHAGEPEPRKTAAEPASIKDVIGGVANVVSIVSTAAFVLSVIYEWAYFLVVGQKFRSIASLTDYLTNALDWLPAVLAGFAAYWLGIFLLVTILGGLTRNKNKGTSPENTKNSIAMQASDSDQQKKQVLWNAVMATALLGGLGVFAYFMADPAEDLWVASALFFGFWIAALGLVFSYDGDEVGGIGSNTRLAIFFVPPLVVGVFLWGLQHGYHDLGPPSEMYRLIRKDSQAQKPEDVSVLRTFERGVLVRLPEQQISEFLRWDEIRSLSLQRDGQAGKSPSCRQLGWLC